jgi:hypothetical protein
MIVTGTVKDATTNTPIPGATVSLYIGADELAVVPSDDKGEFVLSREASYIGQVLTCKVAKEKYQTKEVTHKIDQDEIHLEIKLGHEPVEKDVEVRFSIKDEEENPLEGVNITLDVEAEQVGTGRSDKAGLFETTLRSELEGKTLKYTAKRLWYKTETGQIQLKKETSTEITMKKIVFPLWAKIAAGIAAGIVAVVIVVLIALSISSSPDIKFLEPMDEDLSFKQDVVVSVEVKDRDGIQEVKINGKQITYDSEKQRAKTTIRLEAAGWTKIEVSATDDSDQHKKTTDEIYVKFLDRGRFGTLVPKLKLDRYVKAEMIPVKRFEAIVNETIKDNEKKLGSIENVAEKRILERNTEKLVRIRGEMMIRRVP